MVVGVSGHAVAMLIGALAWAGGFVWALEMQGSWAEGAQVPAVLIIGVVVGFVAGRVA